MLRTTDTLARIRALEQIVLLVFFTTTHLELKKEKPISLKNVLYEAVKIITVFKSPPWVCIFLVFYVTKWVIHVRHFCILSMRVISRRNIFVIVWVSSWTSHFFHGIPFLLKNQIDWILLFRLGYLADILLKMKWACSEENNDNIWYQ